MIICVRTWPKVSLTQARRFGLADDVWQINKLQIAACRAYNANLGSIDICDQLLETY